MTTVVGEFRYRSLPHEVANFDIGDYSTCGSQFRQKRLSAEVTVF